MIHGYFSTVIIIIVMIIISGCADKNITNVQKKHKDNMPDTITQDFYLVETIKGKLQWELSGKTAKTYQDMVNVNMIKCVFFSNNKDMLTVSAEKGILRLDTREIEMKGNITGVDNDKNMFQFSELYWKPEEAALYCLGESIIKIKEVMFKTDKLKIIPDKQIIEAENVKIIIK
jgi:LPS export ABC transporter protein LptC